MEENELQIKKGSAEILVMALLQHEPHHGYQISKLIEERSGGVLRFHVTSLYPTLYRLERRGWIAGQWSEQVHGRPRRTYSLTEAGQEALDRKRQSWKTFIDAIVEVAGIEHA